VHLTKTDSSSRGSILWSNIVSSLSDIYTYTNMYFSWEIECVRANNDGRKGGEAGWVEGWEGGRVGGREGGREGGSVGGREGGRKGGEGGREWERERNRNEDGEVIRLAVLA